jgi:hypothetical protein
MRRLLCAVAIAALALGGCDKKKGPSPPSPQTKAMEAVVAATPASDPSPPSAQAALAMQQPNAGTATR